MLFIIFLAILTIVFLGLGGLAGLGYPAKWIETLETIHYWAYLVIFGEFMIDVVVRVYCSPLI